jgi:hypothetical protein
MIGMSHHAARLCGTAGERSFDDRAENKKKKCVAVS